MIAVRHMMFLHVTTTGWSMVNWEGALFVVGDYLEQFDPNRPVA